MVIKNEFLGKKGKKVLKMQGIPQKLLNYSSVSYKISLVIL